LNRHAVPGPYIVDRLVILEPASPISKVIPVFMDSTTIVISATLIDVTLPVNSRSSALLGFGCEGRGVGNEGAKTAMTIIEMITLLTIDLL
jgi:hypothetical protein